MMSIAQVRSAGSAGNYYTDKDNYYVLGSMGERWAGRGAEQLGLQGSVDKDVFTRLLEGRLPDGADLSRMQDGSNKHRPGYDLTFSAPKSVSMMAMLGGDKRLIDAHNQAVDFAVRQVEALASTRVMTDGQSETVLTGNLVMALFNHDTSRDQEPQLHTHTVVANVTQHNGEWKTLSSDKVGKGKEADLALCFNQHIDGIQPLKTVAVQFFCGQGRHEKSQVRQRYPAASVQTAEKRPRIRIFSQRVTLMAAFFGLRHRPPCGLLLCAERNQCL